MWAIVAVLLLWPVTIAGHPPYWFDSAEYLTSGTRFLDSIRGSQPFDPVSARSVIYSLICAVLRWPGHSMLGVALFQAALSAFVIAVVTRLLAAPGARAWAVGGLLACATPAALFASYVTPDIFAGLLIAAMATLGLLRHRLSLAIRVALAAIAALAVAVHASHPPLAAGMIVTSFIAGLFVGQPCWRSHLASAAWLAAPLAIGMSATLTVGWLAFDEVSVAPKRMPFALARSIHEGPARLYLEDNCATEKYAICEVFGTHYPATIERTLWGSRGLAGRASDAQLQRILDEEPEIVWRALEAHPWLQASRYLTNIGRQLVAFGPNEVRSNAMIERAAGDNFEMVDVPGVGHPHPIVYATKQLSRVSVALALLFLIAAFPAMERRERWLVVLIALGLLGNATICAVFSGVAQRYQARVVWLLPLVALCLFTRLASLGRFSRGP